MSEQSERMEITSTDLLALIRSLPDADKHIFHDSAGCNVTQEWIASGFAGRSFVADTAEAAAAQQIEYLNRHIGHDSIVGRRVTESGWPDLTSVRTYLQAERDLVEANKEVTGGDSRPGN